MARSPNYSPKNPALRVKDATVRAAVIRAQVATGVVAAQSTPMAQHHTEPLTDGDAILTLHPFMLDVDALGAPDALLCVEGTPPTYYRSR